jgi:CheY-like chemotaxis protein
MVLALVDDLMFSSKLKSAASQLGVSVEFVRSSAAALERMRAARPSLLILDLNNPRTDPLGTVAAMRADPKLADVPTIGYVSHVDTALVQAAREAGVSEVMARGAFAAGLSQILTRT